jgi:two-component system, chemotaxis family, chemotaxis protein CheY
LGDIGNESRDGRRAQVSTFRGNLQVAIVGDNESMRIILARALKDQNMEVVGEAGDGLEAIDLIRRSQPHALVMDLQMPRMDGITATKAINAEFPELGVVVFSADVSLRGAALEAGASDFIPKEMPVADLVDKLRQLSSTREPVPDGVFPPAVVEFLHKAVGAVTVTQRRVGGLPTIAYVNQALADLLGYEVEEIVGKGHEFWLSCGIQLDDWTETIAEVRSIQRVDRKLTARRKNGSQIPLHLTMLPFVSQNSFDVITLIRVAGTEPDAPTWKHDVVDALWEALYHGISIDSLRVLVDHELDEALKHLHDGGLEDGAALE